MGVKTGLGLKAVQWFTRGVQFTCAAIILGVYSYFLAALQTNKLPIAHSTRAIEGIAGAAALYTLIALLFLCCLAGFAVTSALAVLLDTAFIAAFIYVAVANRSGAGACRGYVDTPLGAGDAASYVSGDEDNAIIDLPKLCTACRLQTAALIAAIIAILFFIFSIFIEIALVRNRRREARYNPNAQGGPYGPGYGYGPGGSGTGTGKPQGIYTTRNTCDNNPGGYSVDGTNALPEHAHPDQVRSSYGADDVDPAYAKYETGYGHHGKTIDNPAYHYDDGIYTRPYA